MEEQPEHFCIGIPDYWFIAWQTIGEMAEDWRIIYGTSIQYWQCQYCYQLSIGEYSFGLIVRLEQLIIWYFSTIFCKLYLVRENCTVHNTLCTFHWVHNDLSNYLMSGHETFSTGNIICFKNQKPEFQFRDWNSGFSWKCKCYCRSILHEYCDTCLLSFSRTFIVKKIGASYYCFNLFSYKL